MRFLVLVLFFSSSSCFWCCCLCSLVPSLYKSFNRHLQFAITDSITLSLKHRHAYFLFFFFNRISLFFPPFHATLNFLTLSCVLLRRLESCSLSLVQEEYGAEGLDVASIPFTDNQNIIDLISKRPGGLMPILEDQVNVFRAPSFFITSMEIVRYFLVIATWNHKIFSME